MLKQNKTNLNLLNLLTRYMLAAPGTAPVRVEMRPL